jgi:hypothetical protein
MRTKQAPPRFAKSARDCSSTREAFRATRLAVSRRQQWQTPLGAFPDEMNATEYFYCGATGYFGRGGMGL